MPMYVFEAVDGRQVERFFHMAEAPKFGESVWVDGAPFYRIPTRPYATVKESGCVDWSTSPRDLAALGHKSFDQNGCAVFTSQRQIDETVARSQDTPTPLTNVR